MVHRFLPFDYQHATVLPLLSSIQFYSMRRRDHEMLFVQSLVELSPALRHIRCGHGLSAENKGVGLWTKRIQPVVGFTAPRRVVLFTNRHHFASEDESPLAWYPPPTGTRTSSTPHQYLILSKPLPLLTPLQPHSSASTFVACRGSRSLLWFEALLGTSDDFKHVTSLQLINLTELLAGTVAFTANHYSTCWACG